MKIRTGVSSDCSGLGSGYSAYCYGDDEKATLIIKSNDFFLFVSKYMEIRNIIFDGRDLGFVTGFIVDTAY